MKFSRWTLPTLAACAAAHLLSGPVTAQSQPDPARVKRGAYLVSIGACHDCHTPMKMTPDGPMPDMDRALMGRPEGVPDPTGTLGATDLVLAGPDLTAWKQPFGLVYTRNLTPDKTGLGDWTEEQFVNTIRRGRHQGDGRALLPPMPWMQYAMWTDEDAKAVYAYLRTVKPIKNTVADPKAPPQVLDFFAGVNAKIAKGVEEQRKAAQ